MEARVINRTTPAVVVSKVDAILAKEINHV